MNQYVLAGLAYAAGLGTIPVIGWMRYRRPVLVESAAAAAAAAPVTAHHQFDTMDVLASGWALGERSAAIAPAAAEPTRKVDPVTDKLIPEGWRTAYQTPPPNLAGAVWAEHPAPFGDLAELEPLPAEAEHLGPSFDPDGPGYEVLR